MILRLLAAAALLPLAMQAGAQQRDSAAFVVRIGTDTLSLERYVRTPDRITIDAVHRSPATMVHRLSMSLAPDGRVTAGEWTVRPPGAADPLVRRDVRFEGDSAVVTTTQGGTPRSARVAARDATMLAGPFYTPYEMLMMRAVTGGASRGELPLLAGNSLVMIPLERVGRDSIALENQFGEPMRAHVDAHGRLLHLHTPAFTTVERTRWQDIDAMTAQFAARDRTGSGLGPLSPRRASRTLVDGANIWLDYSRPAVRGRPVWGQLVPFGEVWRLGANEATHMTTDRPIELGTLALQPGTYTLFLLPEADAWTLVVNRGTGMSGLARDSTLDVGRVPMTLSPLATPAEQLTIEAAPASGGGTLSVAWDRLRGSVPIRVLRP